MEKVQCGMLVPLLENGDIDVSFPAIPICEGSNSVGRNNLKTAVVQVSRAHLVVHASLESTEAQLTAVGTNAIVVVSGADRKKLPPDSKCSIKFGDVIELLPGRLPFKFVKEVTSAGEGKPVVENIDAVDTTNKRKRQIEVDEAFARALQENEAQNPLLSFNSKRAYTDRQLATSQDVHHPPCTFQLMRVQGITEQANNDCVRISDVIKGEVLVAVLSNYMVDIEWLLSACPLLTQIPQVIVFHGEHNASELQLSKPNNWLLYKPPLRISYGTHHSKAMFLIYPTGLRVVVHTANYISVDWNNKTQGLWYQDFPFKSMTGNMETSRFENDLVEYLTALEWRGCSVNIPHHGELKINAAYFRNFDYSNAAVRLVASVPGYHSGRYLNSWGHLKLRSILQQESFDEKFQGSPLVYQFSSLGSLDEKWMEEFAASTCTGVTACKKPLGPGIVQIVFPTVEDVRCSIEGYRAGNAIPSPAKNVDKPFLKKYWSRWQAEHSGRSHAMPHIKTYLRYQNNSLAWFCLTSANLSKAAWGASQKGNTQLMIRSYELGVLFVPSLLRKFRQDGFSCTETGNVPRNPHPVQDVELCTMQAEPAPNKTMFRLPVPYALPPPRYTPQDQPWSWDKHYHRPDRFGLPWPRTA